MLDFHAVASWVQIMNFAPIKSSKFTFLRPQKYIQAALVEVSCGSVARFVPESSVMCLGQLYLDSWFLLLSAGSPSTLVAKTPNRCGTTESTASFYRFTRRLAVNNSLCHQPLQTHTLDASYHSAITGSLTALAKSRLLAIRTCTTPLGETICNRYQTSARRCVVNDSSDYSVLYGASPVMLAGRRSSLRRASFNASDAGVFSWPMAPARGSDITEAGPSCSMDAVNACQTGRLSSENSPGALDARQLGGWALLSNLAPSPSGSGLG